MLRIVLIQRLPHRKNVYSALLSNEIFFSKKYLTTNAIIQEDIFGEPITFLSNETTPNTSKISSLLESHDYFLLAQATKGQSSASDGGNNAGVQAQVSHALAILWAKSFMNVYSLDDKLHCPIMTSSTLLPFVCHGKPYLNHVQNLIERATSATTQSLPLLDDLITKTTCNKQGLTIREYHHLECLDYLYHDQPTKAMNTLLYLLINSSPGDILALSFLFDIAQICGNSSVPFQAASVIASYHHDRLLLNQDYKGSYTLGAAYISLGFALGNRLAESEEFCQLALQKDKKLVSSLTSLSLAHVYDKQGRVEEGTSLLYTQDGLQNYINSSYLFHDSKLSGYGASFVIHRDGKDKDLSRIYNDFYRRVIDYSQIASDSTWTQPILPAPQHFVKDWMDEKRQNSFLFKILTSSNKKETNEEKVNHVEQNLIQVLTWLPPTPQLLAHGTILLFRMTVNELISPGDEQWQELHRAWSRVDGMYSHLDFCPLAKLTCSLFIPQGNDELCNAFHSFGTLLRLPQSTEMTDQEEKWSAIAQTLSIHYFQYESPQSLSWDIDISSFYETALFYACMQAKDMSSLMIARALCSQGVILKKLNSEWWWRYSLVLKELGDVNASQYAREMCRTLVSGSARA